MDYQENIFCLQVTGGGGYTKENVARCWTVETGVLLDSDLPNGMASDFNSIKALCCCQFPFKPFFYFYFYNQQNDIM